MKFRTKALLLTILALSIVCGIAAIRWTSVDKSLATDPETSDSAGHAPNLSQPLPKSDRPLQMPRSSEKPAEPLRHESSLEMNAALKNFEQSFQFAVGEGRNDFAAELVSRKMMEHSHDGSKLYDWLKPYMERYGFLWQNKQLIHSYWSTCVVTKCDRKEFLNKVESENPIYFNQKKSCMQSWASILQVLQLGEVATPEKISATRNDLMQCLELNGVDGEEQLTQIQYYLGLVQTSSSRAKAEEEYTSMKARIPTIPSLETVIPLAP